MCAAPSSTPAGSGSPAGPVEPITLDQMVDRVFGEKPKTGGFFKRVLKRGGEVNPHANVADDTLEPPVNLDRPGESGRDHDAALLTFLGVPAGVGPLPWLSPAPVCAPDNPQACVRDLKSARAEQVRGTRAAAMAWREARRYREIGLRASVLHELTEAYPERADDLLTVAEATRPAVRQALALVPKKIVRARALSAEVWEEPLTRRVDGALLLLASPAVRGAVPEAAKLRPMAAACAKLAADLSDVAGRVDTLCRRRERFETLVRLQRRLPESRELLDLLTREERWLRTGFRELKRRAGELRFPDVDRDSADGFGGFGAGGLAGDPQGSSVGSVYALDAVGVEEAEAELEQVNTELVDDLRRLNQRTLTELAKLVLRVERGLKLRPLGMVQVKRAA